MLQFETNTACNSRCLFCEHKNMTRKGIMPTSKIIDLIYHFGHKVSEMVPFGMQEPLLEPRLSAILANIKQINPHIQTTLFSNLGVYPEQQLREIVDWGTLDQLEVSFYGATRELYEELQPPLDYVSTKLNIHKVMDLKREYGRTKPTVELMMLHTPKTWKHLDNYIAEWTGKVDKVSMVHYDGWCGKQPYNYNVEKAIWNNPGEQERVPCPRLWNSMYVHYDGSVVPCCLDAHDEDVCGNVFKDWNIFTNSPRLNELRMLHQERRFNEIPLCKNCVTWRYGIEETWNKFWLNAPLP
jgi:radical SAM protein with 4Fe4S-binding SPASM domain